MKKRILLAAGLVAILAAASAVTLAQPQGGPGLRGGPGFGPGPGPRRGGPLDLGLRGIQLNESQREQVRNIMESHRPEFEAVATKLRDAHRAFAQAIEADTVDEAAIRARSSAVAAAMADEAILRAKVRGEVQSLLTPEQQEQLKQRRAERDKRRPERDPQRQPGPRRRGQQ